ncbi:hypothetical protein INT45_005816 [Circinella minor]|uniref:Uncharacterized protein n=1 Tax=Circinella minor TaxID=1195481 RepID=A0A8H7VL90_9FUNG|nr:hypothetical protein INT45_005816 [Circinella minor]
MHMYFMPPKSCKFEGTIRPTPLSSTAATKKEDGEEQRQYQRQFRLTGIDRAIVIDTFQAGLPNYHHD